MALSTGTRSLSKLGLWGTETWNRRAAVEVKGGVFDGRRGRDWSKDIYEGSMDMDRGVGIDCEIRNGEREKIGITLMT